MILLYDGQCDFCTACLRWLQQKMAITAFSFHDVSLQDYGLTVEQCSQSVFVITSEERYSGVAAVSLLLKARGNSSLSILLRLMGPLGDFGYRWIASHRNSFLIRYWTIVLERRLNDES